MIREIKEEIKFAMENPVLTLFVVGTFTGILPSLCIGIVYKILGL